mgnify:FL=1
MLSTCDGIITICPELGELALEHCGDTPHEMIENTGDDQKVFPGGGEDPVAEFGLEGRRLLLYTGTFEAYQGIDLLLDAFAVVRRTHDDAHLVLVGGRDVQIEAFKKRAEELGVAGATTFVGTVHPRRIPAFLKAADVIVSPRCAGTNTPLKIYGYLRSLRPIVATDMPTHTQVLDHGMAVLVAPDAEGIAGGITRVLDDADLRARIREGAERAAEVHSDAAYVRRVLSLYARVMERRALRGKGKAHAGRPAAIA